MYHMSRVNRIFAIQVIWESLNKNYFDSTFEPPEYEGEIFFSDFSGKLPRSIHGHRYFCPFIDQYTRYIHVVRIIDKSETLGVADQYKIMAQAQKRFKNEGEELQKEGEV